MNRRRALALSAASLGIAALLSLAAPPPTRQPFDALGGARPLVVDALFLRADALEREGRRDELPALYRRILELDPTSDAAVDFLADAEARNLAPEAPTPEARAAWIEEALSLVDTALRRNPRSARLHWRRADLLEHVVRDDALVRERLLARGIDRRLEALRELAQAARLTGSIPRLGRIHLVTFSRLVVAVAAERLVARAPGFDEAVALGEEILRVRSSELAELILDPSDPAPAAAVVAGGLALLEMVAKRAFAGPSERKEAKALVAKYAESVPSDPLPGLLEPLFK